MLSAVADDADAPNHRGDDGDAGYSKGVTTEGGDTGSESRPTPPRRFGELPGLVVPDDFDEPLPPTEAAAWEAPDPAAQDASAALDDAWLDWPLDEADLLETLRESEADLAAGRTINEDEIRARYGLPRPDAGGGPVAEPQ